MTDQRDGKGRIDTYPFVSLVTCMTSVERYWFPFFVDFVSKIKALTHRVDEAKAKEKGVFILAEATAVSLSDRNTTLVR